MTKPLHIGRAAQAGIQAAELAEAGLDASLDAIDGKAGLLLALTGAASSVDLDSAVPDEFERILLLQRPGIKKYPVCYASHRVVDGVLQLLSRHRFAPANVARVDASISETAANVLRHHDPNTLTEARFSLEFSVAAAVACGRLGLAEVSEETLRDAEVRELMRRVNIGTVQTKCPDEPSFAYTDQVTVTLSDGSVLDSGPIRFAVGHRELPMDDAQVLDKLRSCVRPGEESVAQRVIGQIDAWVPT
jgi:2-methylcitrate dehydratase PrpD